MAVFIVSLSDNGEIQVLGIKEVNERKTLGSTKINVENKTTQREKPSWISIQYRPYLLFIKTILRKLIGEVWPIFRGIIDTKLDRGTGDKDDQGFG